MVPVCFRLDVQQIKHADPNHSPDKFGRQILADQRSTISSTEARLSANHGSDSGNSIGLVENILSWICMATPKILQPVKSSLDSLSFPCLHLFPGELFLKSQWMLEAKKRGLITVHTNQQAMECAHMVLSNGCFHFSNVWEGFCHMHVRTSVAGSFNRTGGSYIN